MATNRYICEVCHKGFRRDQNLQLHRRGHNLPWKLKQRANAVVKSVCPDPNCVHHDPSRALGDLTCIKKHFFRKHGEKKWKCPDPNCVHHLPMSLPLSDPPFIFLLSEGFPVKLYLLVMISVRCQNTQLLWLL